MSLLPNRIRGVMFVVNSVLEGDEATEVNESILRDFGCTVVESFASMRTHSDGRWPEDYGCSVGYVLETLQ